VEETGEAGSGSHRELRPVGEVPYHRGDSGPNARSSHAQSTNGAVGAHAAADTDAAADGDSDVDIDEAFGFGGPPVAPTENVVQPSQEEENANARASEIHPSLYAPQPRGEIQEPMVHRFSERNRPKHARRRIPVSEVFDAPVNTMWKQKFDTFNDLQSEISNMLAYSDDNVLISAPTGAGKTAVFEMAMARFFQQDLHSGQDSSSTLPKISKRRKIVYVSPSKALCEERFDDWSQRLAAMKLSIEIVVITGDQDPSEAFGDLVAATFVLTTPEKWDSLTRRWTENFFLFASVKLFMVDEVHLIADESRGCCLEAIVCRMKTIQQAACRVRVSQEELLGSRYVCIAYTTGGGFCLSYCIC